MTNYAEKLFLELLRQKELGFIDFEKKTVIEPNTHDITFFVTLLHYSYCVKLSVDTWGNPASHYGYTTTDERFSALHSYIELIKNFSRISKKKTVMPKKVKKYKLLTNDRVERLKRGRLDAEAFQRTLMPYMKTSRANNGVTLHPPSKPSLHISFWRDAYGYISVTHSTNISILWKFKANQNRELIIKLRRNQMI